MVIQSVSSILTGLIIAFIYSWKFALFIIGLAPFFLLAGFAEMKMYAGFASGEELEAAGQVCSSLLQYIGMCLITYKQK